VYLNVKPSAFSSVRKSAMKSNPCTAVNAMCMASFDYALWIALASMYCLASIPFPSLFESVLAGE